MTEDMADRQRAANLVIQLVIAIFLATLVGINSWALIKIVSLSEQVVRNTERIDGFVGAGPRYTAIDAERDQGVVLRILEQQGKTLDDHEGRIRIVERALNHHD